MINLLYHDIIECLAKALEVRDIYTKGHSQRVADMTYFLSNKILTSNFEVEIIHMAAHLHDIGKIGIPDKILNKKGKLTKEEFRIIKQHPSIGYEILMQSSKLKGIAKIVLHHHERWDGNGYPDNLKNEDIPIGSRIIAVCDSIDAMISKRPYRSALSIKNCKEEIVKNSGIMYDPFVVKKTLEFWNDLILQRGDYNAYETFENHI